MTSAAFVAALQAQLTSALPLVAGLEKVKVHLVPTADVVAPAVVLIREPVRTEVKHIAMGKIRDEEVTVPGFARAHGASLQAAADLAEKIVGEVAKQVRTAAPQVGLQTAEAILSALSWTPFLNDKGGYIVDCDYDITYTADLD